MKEIVQSEMVKDPSSCLLQSCEMVSEKTKCSFFPEDNYEGFCIWNKQTLEFCSQKDWGRNWTGRCVLIMRGKLFIEFSSSTPGKGMHFF